ncbi:hypothetical protein SDC9_111050 [bioreactor metagenome]|uniref:Uncharacterized protein n=1 Tax=bioreactor metagenome TaxID=1076179 RepID=A0A645BQR4_9ZZZZ
MTVGKIMRHSGDSLDLLLDAVCNMFGGVMFIALLVVVIASSAPVRSSGTVSDSAAALRRQRLLADRNAALRRQLELVRLLTPEGVSETGEGGDIAAEADALARYRAVEREYRAVTQQLRELRTVAQQQAGADRAAADWHALPETERRREIERLKLRNDALRRDIAALPPEPWRFAPPEKTRLLPWRMILAGGRLYPVGDNAAVRQRGSHDSPAAISYFRYGDADYWQLTPRPERGIPADEFDWEAWRNEVPSNRYFIDLLVDPGDIAAAAAVRSELRRLGYRQSWQVRRPEALVLTARKEDGYEASR